MTRRSIAEIDADISKAARERAVVLGEISQFESAALRADNTKEKIDWGLGGAGALAVPIGIAFPPLAIPLGIAVAGGTGISLVWGHRKRVHDAQRLKVLNDRLEAIERRLEGLGTEMAVAARSLEEELRQRPPEPTPPGDGPPPQQSPPQPTPPGPPQA